jgi:hypothetical protein
VLAPFSWVSVLKNQIIQACSDIYRCATTRSPMRLNENPSPQGQLKAVEMVKVFVVSGCDLKRTAASKPRCTNWRLKVRWLETLELFVLNS